jgi:hypothetical protein
MSSKIFPPYFFFCAESEEFQFSCRLMLFSRIICIRATECATLKGKSEFSGDFFYIIDFLFHADGKLNRQIRCAVRETFFSI